MSAIQQALLAGGPLYIGQMTVVGSASGFNGWGSSLSGIGAFGTMSPVFSGAKLGSMRRLCSLSGTVDLQIFYGSLVAQNYFTGVRVQDASGVIRTYLSSAASFTTGGSESRWQWGTGSSPVYSSGVQPRSVEIF